MSGHNAELERVQQAAEIARMRLELLELADAQNKNTITETVGGLGRSGLIVPCNKSYRLNKPEAP